MVRPFSHIENGRTHQLFWQRAACGLGVLGNCAAATYWCRSNRVRQTPPKQGPNRMEWAPDTSRDLHTAGRSDANTSANTVRHSTSWVGNTSDPLSTPLETSGVLGKLARSDRHAPVRKPAKCPVNLSVVRVLRKVREVGCLVKPSVRNVLWESRESISSCWSEPQTRDV